MADVIQNGYTSAKKGIEAPIFHINEKMLVDVVPEVRLDSLFVREIVKLAEPESFRDAFTQNAMRSDALNRLSMQTLKHHMDKAINETL